LIPPREVAVVWHDERLASEAAKRFVDLAGEIGFRLEARGSVERAATTN
jgi:hypothetical protein